MPLLVLVANNAPLRHSYIAGAQLHGCRRCFATITIISASSASAAVVSAVVRLRRSGFGCHRGCAVFSAVVSAIVSAVVTAAAVVSAVVSAAAFLSAFSTSAAASRARQDLPFDSRT